MSDKKSGAVGRQYHLAVVEKKDREIDILAAEVRRLRAMLEPTPDARELVDRWWCLEGCGFVDKDHRCEQWCQTVRIPKGAQARLLDEAAERGVRWVGNTLGYELEELESDTLRAAIKGAAHE